MKKSLFFLTGIGLMAASVTSCIDRDYDLDKLDQTMVVGGDSLAFPLVNSMKIHLKDFIETDDEGVIRLTDEGYYCIQTEGSVSIDLPKVEVPAIDDRKFSGDPVVLSLSVPTKTSGFTANAGLPPLHAEATDTITASFEIAFPEEIVSLDFLSLKGTSLKISLGLNGLPDIGTVKLTCNVQLPSVFALSGAAAEAGNLWSFTSDITPATPKVEDELIITGLNLAGQTLGADFTLEETLICQIVLDSEGASLPSALTDGVTVTPEISLTHIVPDVATGTFDVAFEGVDERIELGDDMFDLLGEDAFLDILPALRFDLGSNLGMPVDLHARIASYKEDVLADACEFDLWTEASPTPDETATASFWIAADNGQQPAGCDFVEVPALPTLIGSLPEYMRFSVNGATRQQSGCTYYLNADYQACADYELSIPLALGANTLIDHADTIDVGNDFEEFSEYISGIELYGTVSNSIPLSVVLMLTPADTDGRTIGFEPIRVGVSAGNADGTPYSSEISAKLSDTNGRMCEIGMFLLEVSLGTPPRAAHTLLKPDQGLDITLKCRIPGGITLSTDEL